jgi:hypothetical protein
VYDAISYALTITVFSTDHHGGDQHSIPALLVNSGIDGPSHDMALDVVVPEDALRIDRFDDADKVVKSRVHFAEGVRAKFVSLGPVRSAFILCDDGLVPLEQSAIWYVESVWPERITF